MLGARKSCIPREDSVGFLRGLADQLRVDIGKIDDAQLGNTVLSRSEEFARASDRKVDRSTKGA